MKKFPLLLLCLVFFGLVSVSFAYSSTSITGNEFDSGYSSYTNSVNVWHLNSNLTDSKGGLTFDANGTPAYLTGLFSTNDWNSKLGNSLNTTSSTIQQGDANFSISMWVYQYNRTSWRLLNVPTGQTNEVRYFLIGENAGIGLGWGKSGSSLEEVNTTALTPNEWHHIVLVRNVSDSTFKLYIDGDLNATINETTVGEIDTTSKITFGNITNSDDVPFSGMIEDIVTFNSALSAEDVNTLTTEYLIGAGFHSVSFTYSPLNPLLDYDAGQDSNTVSFFNLSDQNATNVTFYKWDLNGVQIADTNNLSHAFTAPGDYNVALIMGWDNNSTINQNSLILSVKMKPQDFNLTNLPLTPTKNESIKFTFDANVSPAIKTIGVNFGDLNTSYYAVTGLIPFDFNHVYSSGGSKTVTVTASSIQDVNKSFTYDVNLFGSIQLNFFDENTTELLNPTVTFDSNAVLVTDGVALINLSGMASKTYTILALMTGKTERRWDFDLNQFSDLNVSLALLDTNKGTSVQFKFYSPDLNILDNAWITGRIRNTFYTWKQKTDSAGYITMFLNTNDSNNFFEILSKTDQNYIYYGTTVTVKKPLDEETNAVLSPFNLSVGGLAAQNYSGLAADKTVQIFSDTVKTYEFNVDFNTDYYPRNYSVRTQGGLTTYTIQPYLLQYASSVFPAITVIDNVTGATISNILIKTYGNDLFLESRVTDSTGSAQMSFKITKTYKLYFYDANTDELLLTATLIPQSGDTEYTVRLNRTDIGGGYVSAALVYVNFNPSDYNIFVVGDTTTFSQDVNVQNDVITWVKITITKSGTTIYDNNFSTYIIDSNTFSQTLNTAGWEQNDVVYIKVSLGTLGGAFNYYNNSAYSSYVIQVKQQGIFILLQRVKDEELGIIGTTIISILITLIVLGGFKAYFNINNKAITIIGVGVLMIFTLINWLPTIPVIGGYQIPVLFVILIPASIIYLVRESREI